MSDQEDDYVIRNLAYELWDKAGRPPGKHLDFWEQATRRIGPNATAKGSPGSGGHQVDEAPTTALKHQENESLKG